MHLVTCLLAVIDLLKGDGAWSEEVAELGQINSIPQTLLQLCGWW